MGGNAEKYSIRRLKVYLDSFSKHSCQSLSRRSNGEVRKKYSGYFIFKNKGYGTKEHLSLIKKNGITKLHRKSFLKKSNLI